MKKNNLIDFLIILLIYIGLSCFPFSLISDNILISKTLQIAVQVLILVFIFYFVKNKSKLECKIEKINWKYTLLLLPTLIVCFSNYFFILSLKSDISFSFDKIKILDVVLIVFVAINEELIFRLLLISNLEKTENWWLVLISSLAFGLCHLTVFLSTFNPADLIVVAYTIPLGALLAISFLLSKTIFIPIIIHFLFNAFNDTIYSCFLLPNYDYSKFILINALVSIIVAMYMAIMLILISKNKNKVIESN